MTRTKSTDKRSLYLLMLSMILMIGLFLSSCVSKPGTIEELIDSNSDVKEQIQTAAGNAGMSIGIKGNEITYTYDLSTIQGATEENLRDEAMLETLKNALDSQQSVFAGVCKNIEDETGISGVSAVVNYTYGDEVLITQTFTSSS